MVHTALVLMLPFICAALVALILLQHGKGADAGAAFGSGASTTVFGARGSANFLSRATAWLAATFFAVTLALGYLVREHSAGHSVIDALAPKPSAPASALPVAPTLSNTSVTPLHAPAGAPSAAAPLGAPPAHLPAVPAAQAPKTLGAPASATSRKP